ncbi:hypothetical protein [Pantoea septica]|uniref:hypothetical protein n=1 Tax=Pantoea septica TaxID=472695 RepID=UPI0028AA1109|nr:hypothetical protein [Pantoea septica]
MYEHVEAYSSLAQKLNFQHFSSEQENRSMTKRNQKLFDILKAISEENGFDKKNYSYQEKICIETNQSEKDWLQTLSSDEEFCGANSFNIVNVVNVFSVSYFYYSGEKYLIISGLDDLTLDEGFEFEEMNAGIFTLFSSLNLIKFKNFGNNISQVYDNFLFKENDEVRHIPMNNIISYFDPTYIFKVSKGTLYHELALDRMSSYIAISKIKEHYPKDTPVFSLLQDLIIAGENSINFSHMAKAIFIKDEPYLLFMELYRMLERIYAIPTVNTLKNELSIGMNNHWDIISLIEKTTGWRKKENEGLYTLLSQLEPSTLNDAYNILCKNHGNYFNDDSVQKKQKLLEGLDINSEHYPTTRTELQEAIKLCLRDYIYKTRNSYVHYREALESHLDQKMILSLCEALLMIINPIYVKLGVSY